MTKEKTCYVCGETKLKTLFYRDRRRKDGRQSRCKDCNHKTDIKKV